MARIRTIKPEFFTHAGIFDAEAETGLPLRVAYIGLWTQCDREGRFEWRPRELGVRITPYDNVDFSRVLDALATRGFLVRYESQGKVFGFIPSWRRHQVINNKERASEIPEPPKNAIENSTKHYASASREQRDENASTSRAPRVVSGRERKGKEDIDSLPPSESLPPRARANGTTPGGDEGFEEQARALTSWFSQQRAAYFPTTPELEAPFNSIQTILLSWLRQGLPPAKIQATIAECMAKAAAKGARPPHSPKAYERSLEDALRRHHEAHGDPGAPAAEETGPIWSPYRDSLRDRVRFIENGGHAGAEDEAKLLAEARAALAAQEAKERAAWEKKREAAHG